MYWSKSINCVGFFNLQIQCWKKTIEVGYSVCLVVSNPYTRVLYMPAY
jgi:hypothetical protein